MLLASAIWNCFASLVWQQFTVLHLNGVLPSVAPHLGFSSSYAWQFSFFSINSPLYSASTCSRRVHFHHTPQWSASVAVVHKLFVTFMQCTTIRPIVRKFSMWCTPPQRVLFADDRGLCYVCTLMEGALQLKAKSANIFEGILQSDWGCATPVDQPQFFPSQKVVTFMKMKFTVTS